MKVITKGKEYDLAELGTNRFQRLIIPGNTTFQAIHHVLIKRTEFLFCVQPCTETGDAIHYLIASLKANEAVHGTRKLFQVEELNEGHTYRLQTPKGEQTLVFLKRSSGMIKHENEWPGLLTQEVLRALIDYSKHRDSKTSDREIQNLRQVFFRYEARAWTRKKEKKNGHAPKHDDTAHPRVTRSNPYDGVPFNHQDIELRPTSPEDGHIRI